jgi:threonine/homoserine/homoserine lactone efflux protein
MFFRGFKYGMLLQLAVGPVCMLVFQTAGAVGFFATLPQILGVALVDAAFLALAGAGAVMLLRHERVQILSRVIAALVLFLFGITTVLSVFGITLIPGFDVSGVVRTQGVFWQGVILTASNPMTILFWNSLLASQTAKTKMSRGEIAYFGGGCVLSTVVFLCFIAMAGSLIDRFLPPVVTQTITVLVGIGMIFYSGLTFIRRGEVQSPEYAK